MGAECCGTSFQGERGCNELGVYRGVKLLKHAMKIVEKVLETRLRHMVKVNQMQFGFMPGKGTIDMQCSF